MKLQIISDLHFEMPRSGLQRVRAVLFTDDDLNHACALTTASVVSYPPLPPQQSPAASQDVLQLARRRRRLRSAVAASIRTKTAPPTRSSEPGRRIRPSAAPAPPPRPA